MKIIDKSEPKRTVFGKLSSGDVFFRNGGFYIKTNSEHNNAVYLQSGFTLKLNDDEQVQKVNATLIIRGGEE